MLAALMIGPHNSASAFIRAPSSSGVELATVTPRGSNRAFPAGVGGALSPSARFFFCVAAGGLDSLLQGGVGGPLCHVRLYLLDDLGRRLGRDEHRVPRLDGIVWHAR